MAKAPGLFKSNANLFFFIGLFATRLHRKQYRYALNRQKMRLDELFYYLQPVRDYLFENCDVKDFCCLLCCNWTMYGSFRRRTPQISKQLQLSDLYWQRYVCCPTVSETEFKLYIKSLYDALSYNGQFLCLYHPDWHAPAVQRSVSIALEAWMAVNIKCYDSPWQSAVRAYSLDRGFVPIADEPNTDEEMTDAIDWIVQQLRLENVFCANTGRSRFINASLYKFVFLHRSSGSDGRHHEWLRTQKNTTIDALFEQFMQSVGIYTRI